LFAQKKLSIGANTAKTSPASVEFTLTPGLLEKVWVHFPDGCNQLVNVVVLHGERQIIPKDENESIAGNDFTYEITQALRILPGHEKFVAKGWSPGTSYDHGVLISIDTFAEEERDVSEDFLAKISGTLVAIGKMLGVR